MKILKINIEDFGCFSKRSFEFSGDLNLILGENESGKSTLLSFIKFILYGLPKKSGDTVFERLRSISWTQSVASGSMQIEVGDKIYTISRRGVLRATAKRESYTEDCTIVDESLGIEVHKGECPGELFLGVPLAVYESTCFISQLGSSDLNVGDVSQSLQNMLVSADEGISLQKALDKIDSARKLFLHKNGKGGSLFELGEEENRLSERLSVAMGQFNQILAREDAIKEMKASLSEKRSELDRVEDTLSALNLVSVAKRFELLHEKQAELLGLQNKKEEFIKENCSPDRTLPNAEFINSLSEAISALASAKESAAAAKERLVADENALKEFMGKESKINQEKLTRTLNPEATCDTIRADILRAAKLKKSAKTETLIAILSFVIGAILGGGLFFLVNALVGGGTLAAFSIIGTVLLAIGANSRKKAAGLLNSADSALSEFGISENEGDLLVRVELLRNAIKRFFEDRAKLDELNHNKTCSLSAYDIRLDDLKKAENTQNALLSSWDGGKISPDDSLDKAKMVFNELSAMSSEESYLKRTIGEMARELAEYNEKDIRARIPASVMEKYTLKDVEEFERKKKFLSDSIKFLSDKTISSERELIQLQSKCDNPARISASLYELRAEKERQSQKLDALVLASEALTSASANIRSTVTPILREKAGEYLSVLTSGKYDTLGIDEEYNMSTRSGEKNHSVSLLSAGTKDLAYISLRLALLHLLFKDEPAPLTLDDALAQLDNGRAKNALSLLASYCKGGGQCLLFSCHTREEEMIGDIIKPNIIRL